MKLKKTMVVLLAIAVAAAFTACGKSGSSSGSGDKVTLHFANTLATSNAWNRAAKDLKKDLDEKSDGKIELVIDAGGVHGSDKEQAESCASGDLAMVIGSTVGLDAYVTEMGWINMPYVLHTTDGWEKS